ncbi:MAG: hypothetical protein ACO1NO_14470 [Burkholderiaceae bacterium]
MESTVIGVYDNYEQAQNAMNELVRAGFGRADIQLTPGDQTPNARQTALRAEPRGGERSTRDDADTGESTIGQFFGKIFGTYANTNDKANHGDVMSDAELFSEAIRRGSYLLAVQARNDEQHDEIVNIMDRFGPIDIDERGARWRMQGWSRYDSNAPVLSQDEIERERAAYQTRADQGVSDAGNYTQTEVGQYDTTGVNRERRGVRVYSRSVDTGPLSNASTASTGAAATGLGTAASGMDTTTTGTTMGGSGYDDDYRSHWQSNYGHLGGRYEDHAPAYQYGSRLASDERYSNYHQWNDMEANARTDWESQNAGHPWEKAKDAVRYSWERVTNKGRQ